MTGGKTQAVNGTQRRVRQMRGARVAAAVCIPVNVFVLAVDLALGSAMAIVPAVLIVAQLILIAALTRLIGIARARASTVSVLTERRQTLAESVAEAVEAQRQRQWDLIAERAYLAMGGRPPAETGMASVRDLELGFARLGAVLGPCAHPDAEPVKLLMTGETVAWVCLECYAQLPANWA